MDYKDFRYEVYDIETYLEMFCYVGKNLQTGEVVVYEISRRRNDLFKMVKHLVDGNIDYFVGYNSLGFDSQVVQYIVDTYQKWVDFEWFEVVDKIYKFAQRLIDDLKHDLFPPYREEILWKKQLDPFKIHHFDNENKRVSLKWLEFSLDMYDIEEMPVPFDKVGLTDEDIDKTIYYCEHDTEAAEIFLKLTFGETELELYQGKNKVQERLDVMEDYKLPQRAINWSDVKIGDEINLKGYMQAMGIDRKAVYDLKLRRRPMKRMKFGDCIPSYVEFESKEFRDFYDRVRKEVMNLNDNKQEFKFGYNGTVYTIKKGGIHSNEKKRRILPKEDEILEDADIGGQYPNSICKRELYPYHLGPKWLVNYRILTLSRPVDKAKGKDKNLSEEERRKYKSRAEMKKLATNGGGFGKTNERNSWQYGPEVQYAVTIGNQFEILMLIEKMELNGIHIISANTDGILALYSKDKVEKYKEICEWWEKKVGNFEHGKLEYTIYEKMIQTSVNDYIAIKKDEKDPRERVKKKGDFATEFEINKNKSRRIIPLALEQYFVNDIPVEETILKHKRIFDFCVGVKSNRDYHYKFLQGEEVKTYNSVVRYYLSKEGGKLLKYKREGSQAEGNRVSETEAPDKDDDKQWKVTIANHIKKDTPIEEYGIDYEYYIRKAKKIIQGIENPRKKFLDPNQISMF